MSTPSLTREELLFMIKTNERQRDVAKSRGEYDVVAYHQKAIDELNYQLQYTK